MSTLKAERRNTLLPEQVHLPLGHSLSGIAPFLPLEAVYSFGKALLWSLGPLAFAGLILVAHGANLESLTGGLQNLFLVSTMMGVGLAAYWLSMTVIACIPESLSKVRKQVRLMHSADPILQLGMIRLHGLRHYISLTNSFLACAVTFRFLAPLMGVHISSTWTHKLIYSAVILSVCLLVEKMLVQQLAASFHSHNYRDRAERLGFALRTLGRLKNLCGVRISSRWYFPTGSSSAPNTPSGGGRDAEVTRPVVSNRTRQVTIMRSSGKKVTIRRDSILTGGLDKWAVKDAEDYSLDDLAQLVPEAVASLSSALFEALVPKKTINDATGGEAEEVVLKEDDLHQAFKQNNLGKEEETFDEVKRFWSILDPDCREELTREEWCRAVEARIYADHDAMVQSMTANSAILLRVDQIGVVTAMAIGTYYLLPIIEDSLLNGLTTSFVFVMPLVYMVKTGIQKVAESIMFTLVTHPFDIGDIIHIDGQGYTVVGMDLTQTLLLHGPSNQLTFVENEWLANSAIINTRRSSDTTESITIPFDTSKCSSESIRAFEADLLEYLQDEAWRDFLGDKCHISGIKIISREIMQVDLHLVFRGNLFEGKGRDARFNGVMKWIREVGIPKHGLALGPVNWDY